MTKISAIVRSDACGLGTLSRMFADYLGFHRTVSIARHRGGAWPEWYGENNREANDGLTPDLVAWACDGADVLLSFETWYGDVTPRVAIYMGVKTALMPMYECCPLAGSGLEYTDLAICVSGLDLVEATKTPGLANALKHFCYVPFDTERIAFRRRERALTFLHNAGHGGLDGRNSTAEVLAAWRNVESPARLIVRLQPGLQISIPDDPRISAVESNPENYWELFDEGDVLLHPTKWDALSLPIQEALTAGMPIMTTRYWPFCDTGDEPGWLPYSIQRLAIPWERIETRSICRQFQARFVSPLDIAAAVDSLYGESIEQASNDARACAEQFSWSELLPHYQQIFDDLVSSK